MTRACVNGYGQYQAENEAVPISRARLRAVAGPRQFAPRSGLGARETTAHPSQAVPLRLDANRLAELVGEDLAGCVQRVGGRQAPPSIPQPIVNPTVRRRLLAVVGDPPAESSGLG